MEIITGVPTAEYGDKSSLVVHIVTKSGLNQTKPAGSVTFGYGSFSSPSAELNLGIGSKTVGNFLTFDGLGTERFLDPPELTALHDKGTRQSFFDRLDVHPSDKDTFHLNIQAARSSFDVPNTRSAGPRPEPAPDDQQLQRRARLCSPPRNHGGAHRERLRAAGPPDDAPSADPFADTPGSVSQDRTLTNIGAKVDVEYTAGMNDVKVGGTVGATKLDENFSLGFTDPTFNSPCLDVNGDPSDKTSLTKISQCTGVGSARLVPNPDFSTDLLAFDLTRGGQPFQFSGADTIKQQAFYIQDSIKAGNATFNLGVRFDHYDGLTTDLVAEPRLGVSYLIPQSGTVLRLLRPDARDAA
jgi:hypothetical protein